jgi:hypothetical protein
VAPGQTPQSPTTPAVRAESEEDHSKKEIAQLVKDYCAAYETLKPENLQKIFPLIDQRKLKEQFKQMKSLRCTVTSPPEFDRIDVNGAGGAQLKFGMKRELQGNVGGVKSVLETNVLMVVSRTSRNVPWHIDSAEHSEKPK